MSDIAHLIRASVANAGEDTLTGALADAMDEAHPANKDGRAELLRKRASQITGTFGLLMGPTHSQHYDDGRGGADIRTQLFIQPTKVKHIRAWISLYDQHPEFGSPGAANIASRSLTHEEARDIADHLPHAEQTHTFLDTHIGPDPRPIETRNKYARDYGDAIK